MTPFATFAGALLGLAITAQHALAQFPPPLDGVTVLKSKFNQDITISYKEVKLATCLQTSDAELT